MISKSADEQTARPAQARWVPAKPLVRKLVDELGIRAAGRLGVYLDLLLGRRVDERLGMLTYHRTAPPLPGAPEPLHNVAPERLRQQIAGLRARGFTFYPLSRVLDCRRRGVGVPRRTVVLTFDDGFETIYTWAWPVLREFEVPATVFLTTAYLDGDAPFPCDDWGMAYQDCVPPEWYRPLTSAQCLEMAAGALVELGAHTHTHEDFRCRAEAFRKDLQISVDILRTRFGRREVPFAFPYGSPHRGFTSRELAQAARQTGVVCGLTTESTAVDLASDPFCWGRFNVFPWDTGATLAAKLDGWYGWAPKLRQQIARFLLRSG
jgi:peptidoglycan/xylan/chitin deacetylase (PgdA/CDA1 family)